MIQKIYLGIMALSLLTITTLFFPVSKYYRNYLINENLQEKREELVLAEERLNVIAATIGVFDDVSLETVKTVLDGREYIYNNFEKEFDNYIESIELYYNFNVNDQIEEYEELMTVRLRTAYVNSINKIVSETAASYFKNVELNTSEENYRRILSYFVRDMRMTNDFQEMETDDYIDLEASRNFYTNDIDINELKESMVENYLRFLDDNI